MATTRPFSRQRLKDRKRWGRVFTDPVSRPQYLAAKGRFQKHGVNMQDHSSVDTHRKSDPQNIADAIRILFEPEQVVELRAPKAGKHGTISGYFSDHKRLALELEELSGTYFSFVKIWWIVP